MRNRFPLLILVSLALAACSGVDSDSDNRQPVDIDAWTGEMPIAAPWLREILPAGVLTYERIPHPLGLIGIPKGNSLDTALGSEANISNLVTLQQGLADTIAANMPPLQMLDALRSPIEIAAIGAPPLSSVMIGATVSYRSDAEFESLITELGQFAPGLALGAPLDEEGFAQLVLPPGLPIQVFVNFDETTGRLALYGGIVADRVTFGRLLAATDRPADHPMHSIEAQIDDSGQGLFAWVDAAQALQAGAGFLPPEMAAMIGTMQISSVGLGAGVANGKGRLKLLLDTGVDNPNRPLPIVRNAITATTVGDTRHLFLLSIPSAEEFTRMEALVLANFPPETRDAWAQAKNGFAEASGTSIEEILQAVGPELITISDQAGDYFALHINDHDAFDSLLDRWTANGGVPVNSRQVNGETIHSIELPSSFGLPDAAIAGEAAAVLEVIGRMRTRFFWIADGDYLYAAGTPQLLIDRIALGAEASVADWLNETQRIDMSSSMLAATGSAERLPQMMYNGYVGMMQTFADLVGVEYDIWSMPTANQLGLPERGTLGASLNLGEPYISLELSYESNPGEFLLGGGGMASVAAIGIVAAVALPAYQDYTIRAQVSEGLNLAAAPKAAVAETYLLSGEAPADRAAAGMTPDASDSQGLYVQSIDIVDAEIFVSYGNAAHPQISGTTLVLTPLATPDDSVLWVCGRAVAPPGLMPIGSISPGATTIQAQYLPSACR